MENALKTAENLVTWLRHRVREAGGQGVVVGVSGGVDSALTAALCQRAFSDNVLGLIMPCDSRPLDIEDAKLVVETLRIPFKIIDLQEVYSQFIQAVGGNLENHRANGNVKARLRMMTLYFYANAKQYLVVGTGNRTEFHLGYFTKYGDGGVDLLPLGGLLKAEVYALAKDLRVPERIISKPPSAGLWPGQTDERELGFPYAELDAFVRGEIAEPRLAGLAAKTSHKRRMPAIPTLDDINW